MRALRMRGGAVWQLVGLITRRSQVQILPPLPGKQAGPIRGSAFFLPAIPLIDVRFTPGSGHSGNIAVNDR